jgi:hypothetical protein
VKSLGAAEQDGQGGDRMSKHVTFSATEAADRLAIRELVEAYAHCADRRDANGQMSLFAVDTHFVVYTNAKDPTPSQERHWREALAPVFAENKYEATPSRGPASDAAPGCVQAVWQPRQEFAHRRGRNPHRHV